MTLHDALRISLSWIPVGIGLAIGVGLAVCAASAINAGARLAARWLRLLRAARWSIRTARNLNFLRKNPLQRAEADRRAAQCHR